MATFQVLCRVDAYVDYLAEVVADTAREAAEIARESHSDYEWRRDGEQEFEASRYITLNSQGEEIVETECDNFDVC